jgi:CMP-N-acetylneuraminic acid synthetase
MAYTISCALQSRIFSAVVVSTDSQHYAEVSRHYGAEVPFLRPDEFADDLSPDIEWVEFTLDELRRAGREYDCFSLLRPTSPFRQPATIVRAWKEFLAEDGVDSLRAVEKARQHPGKMWVVRGRRMHPLLPLTPENQPWHSSQYQSLPEVYVQNASLEIGRTQVVFEGRTIAGNVLLPFFTQGYEGFDLNQPHDWRLAEELAANGEAVLPVVAQAPFQS